MDIPSHDDIVHFRCSESLITCQICMEKFESPRILPCQHTFCKKCIVSLMRKHSLNKDGSIKTESSFPCPNCRRLCKIKRKGKSSIENQLDICFQENLLLKELLESVEERPSIKEDKAWGEIEKEKLPYSVDKRKRHHQYIHKRHIFVPAAQVIEERLWFYYLFIFKLIRFLDSCENSVRTVKRASLIALLQDLIRIPETIFNTTMQRRRTHMPAHSMDIDGILRSIQLIESDFLKSFSKQKRHENMNTQDATTDVETQTDQNIFNNIVCLFWICVSCILTYNISPVVLLWQYIFNIKLDMGKLFFIKSENRYESEKWYLTVLLKSVEVLTLIYLTGEYVATFLPLLLIVWAIIHLLIKQISVHMYFDGSTPVRNMTNKFLISLNILTNSLRGYMYFLAVIRLNFRSLLTLFCCELLQIFVFTSLFGIILYRHMIKFKTMYTFPHRGK